MQPKQRPDGAAFTIHIGFPAKTMRLVVPTLCGLEVIPATFSQEVCWPQTPCLICHAKGKVMKTAGDGKANGSSVFVVEKNTVAPGKALS